MSVDVETPALEKTLRDLGPALQQINPGLSLFVSYDQQRAFVLYATTGGPSTCARVILMLKGWGHSKLLFSEYAELPPPGQPYYDGEGWWFYTLQFTRTPLFAEPATLTNRIAIAGMELHMRSFAMTTPRFHKRLWAEVAWRYFRLRQKLAAFRSA